MAGTVLNTVHAFPSLIKSSHYPIRQVFIFLILQTIKPRNLEDMPCTQDHIGGGGSRV